MLTDYHQHLVPKDSTVCLGCEWLADYYQIHPWCEEAVDVVGCEWLTDYAHLHQAKNQRMASSGCEWLAEIKKRISERKIPSLLAGFFHFYSMTIFRKTFRSPDLSIETFTHPMNFDNDVILIEVISFNSFTMPLDVSLCRRRR